MRGIILFDTSILCEWLQIPKKSTSNGNKRVEKKMCALAVDFDFFLPLAAVIETGNHIAHIKNAQTRRSCAEALVALIDKCIAGKIPYATIAGWDVDDLKRFSRSFVANATVSIGMGDTTMISDFEKLCERYPTAREIRIWSLDGHLDSYRKVQVDI